MTHNAATVRQRPISRKKWAVGLILAAVVGAGLVPVVSADPAEAAVCDNRTRKTSQTDQTYVPTLGYVTDINVAACAAQEMSDAWGTASGSTGAAGTVIGLLNGWTGFAFGAISASQWLTTVQLNQCSNGFTSNIALSVHNGQIIDCKPYSGSIGGGSF